MSPSTVRPIAGVAAAIYGTILSASVIVAWDEEHVSGLALTVVLTGLLFAISHGYAAWLAERSAGRSTGIGHIARIQWPLLEACLAPAAILVVTEALVGDDAALWIALGFCAVQQVLWALAAVRRSSRGSPVQDAVAVGFVLLVAAVLALVKAVVH